VHEIGKGTTLEAAEKLDFGWRSAFSAAISSLFSMRLYRPLKKSILHLILGGAAVHRCDNWPALNDGFSR